MSHRSLPVQACEALVLAYQAGADNGGSIEWSDLDDAHALAVKAAAFPEAREGETVTEALASCGLTHRRAGRSAHHHTVRDADDNEVCRGGAHEVWFFVRGYRLAAGARAPGALT